MTPMALSGLVLVGLAALAACGSTNPAGSKGAYRGYRWVTRGAVASDDFEWHWGWNDPATYDVRWNTYNEKVSVLSADNLPMTVDVALWMRPTPRDVFRLHPRQTDEVQGRIAQGMRHALPGKHLDVGGVEVRHVAHPPPAIAARKETSATHQGSCPNGGDCPRPQGSPPPRATACP